MNHRRKNSEHSEKQHWLSLALAAVALNAACVLVLCLLCTLAMLKTDLPDIALKVLGMLIPGITGMVSGLFLARMEKSKGLVMGLLSCIPAALLLAGANVIMHPGAFSFTIILKLVILFICGAIGGVLGVNMRKRIKV